MQLPWNPHNLSNDECDLLYNINQQQQSTYEQNKVFYGLFFWLCHAFYSNKIKGNKTYWNTNSSNMKNKEKQQHNDLLTLSVILNSLKNLLQLFEFFFEDFSVEFDIVILLRIVLVNDLLEYKNMCTE